MEGQTEASGTAAKPRQRRVQVLTSELMLTMSCEMCMCVVQVWSHCILLCAYVCTSVGG